jgi:Zn-dependent peptidase ImmA (M78 family)/transcriptional regulator with XRE-family HTH domain
MLKWARETLSIDIDSVSSATGISVTTLKKAEEGEKDLTMNQLRKISKKYKRPLYFFYLNNEPENLSSPDFRSTDIHHSNIRAELNPIIRELKTKKIYAEELAKDFGLEFDYAYLENFSLSNTISDNGIILRNLLDVNTEAIKGLRDHDVLNYWKHKVENINVLVFQFSGIDSSISRGFSFNNTPFPIIAINQKDSYYARVFTIIHELGHIVLKNSGICGDVSEFENIPDIEKICNEIASEVLLPTNEFTPFINNYTISKEKIIEILEVIEKKFKVSWTVALIKLKNNNLITTNLYQTTLWKLQVKFEKVKENQTEGGKGDYYTSLISKVSPKYLKLVMKGLEEKKFSYSKGMKFLGQSYKVLLGLEERNKLDV